ncbi:MAG TPA: hypothetical protein VN442_25800 [Bryobacteraceae bacterium]|nr:hypothetical protein [Bryobacteraceae bacterium]
MPKNISPEQERLISAALKASRWLRRLAPELDRAIAAGRDHDGLLQRLRDLAEIHADALRHGLKDRAPRQNRDSARFQPLWGGTNSELISRASSGRYVEPRRRNL